MLKEDGPTVTSSRRNVVSRLQFRLKKRRQVLRELRLTQRGWYDPSARSEHPAIFIGGCGRSGTTLLREMLNRHPAIACGPETSIFGLPFDVQNQSVAWSVPKDELDSLASESENIVEYAESFFDRYLLRPYGKPRWADKTPNNVRVLPKLLTWFPRGKFIHLIRDGRDVVCSLRHHPRERIVDGRLVPVKRDNPIGQCATRWLKDTSAGFAFRGHPRYLEVRYEELVMNPEHTLQQICSFVGEAYDPGMLKPPAPEKVDMRSGRLMNNPNAAQSISSNSIGRWKRDLSLQERRDFYEVAGELLVVAGYVKDPTWVEQHTLAVSDRKAKRAV